MKIKNILMTLGLGSMLMTSCSLDEEVYTFISGEDLAADGEYELLVNGAYQPLAWLFEWGSYDSAVNYDNDYQTGPGWAFKETGTGNFYNNGSINNLFEYYSTAIHRANYHYYLISTMTNVAEKEKNNALGELRFLKAWAEFELVRRFGPIPIFKTSINEGNDTYQPRASVKEVYEDIIANLKEAETLLMPRTDANYQKGHVFRASAKSLLALVYATIGSASMESGRVMVKGGPGKVTNPDGTESALMPQEIWHDKIRLPGYEEFDSQEYYRLAKEKAGEVITEGECTLAASQKDLWALSNKNGPEFLFCLQTYPDGDNLSGNYLSESYYGYWDDDGTMGKGYYTYRDHWLQMFDDWDDERITWGILHRYPGSYNSETGVYTWYYYPLRDSVYVNREEAPYEGIEPYQKTDQPAYGAYFGSRFTKFTAVTGTIDGTRKDYNWPFLRYAEVLLLYAEVDNELNGPTQDAFSKMEMLNRRNNSTLVSERHKKKPFDKETFRSFILEERAKEFAVEGNRRTDLIRWGIYLPVMNAIGMDENGNLKRREEKHWLMPLPPDEINGNPYIEKNNPGW